MKKDYIFDIIKNSNKTLTAEDIYNQVSKNIEINLSTVYRTLNRFVDKEVVTKVVRQDKIAYYEIKDDCHKHYIICDKCNISLPTNTCNITTLEKKIKRETGFNIIYHNLELHGICGDCKKNA